MPRSARRRRWPANPSSTPRPIIGPPAPPRRAAGRAKSRRCCKAAARSQESFYGLMARETLGMDKRLPKSAASRDLDRLEALPNIRRATELLAMGRRAQAEELLRHQAKIGNPAEHRSLVRVAKKLELARRAILARPFRPAGRAGRCRRPLSDAQLDALQWLAGRSGAGLCPHHPGIELPHRRGQPRWRGRPDAGAARHRRRHGAQPRAPASAPRASRTRWSTSTMARRSSS